MVARRVGALKGDVIVGLARKELLDSYETLFAEAGISMAAATFSSAVIHAALRIWSAAPASLLCFQRTNAAAPKYTARANRAPYFRRNSPLPRERALALARAELRMAPDYPARPLSEVLPLAPGGAGQLPIGAFAYAAAIAGSAPRVANFANLLPPERRASHDRMQYLVPGDPRSPAGAGAADGVRHFPGRRTEALSRRISIVRRGSLEPAASARAGARTEDQRRRGTGFSCWMRSGAVRRRIWRS